jgi:3-methyladenine DNA glycosylase/8-oxoguanine DNA glycosylase
VSTTAEVERRWRPGHELDLVRTLGVLRRGAGDPAHRVDESGAVWRGVCTPTGAGTLRLSVDRSLGEVTARSWGPGAAWLAEHAPAMCGALDDPSGFVPHHPVVAQAAARHPGFRIARAEQVLAVLVPTVLEQKTTGHQAWASWRELVGQFGEPAPGPAPAGLRVPPPAGTWARIPSWTWHRAGVEPARSRTIVGAALHPGRLEETLGMEPAAADARLQALPGLGPWTSAEVRQRAHGDPDAVSVGDFHLPHTVGVALTGHRVDDAGMLELLAPYVGQRYRACALIELSGVRSPRYGPRLTIQDHRGH